VETGRLELDRRGDIWVVWRERNRDFETKARVDLGDTDVSMNLTEKVVAYCLCRTFDRAHPFKQIAIVFGKRGLEKN
jgi:hypothetical protein